MNKTWGHFYQVHTKFLDIRTNLLYQIKMTKGFVIIDYNCNDTALIHKKDLIEGMFTELLKDLKAVILITGEEDGFFCSDENSKKQLILSDKGLSDCSYFFPEQTFVMQPSTKISQLQIERRIKSQAVLKEKGIFVPAWYPVIESEEAVVRPEKEAIAGRAAALMIVALYSECLLGEGMDRAEARSFIYPIIVRFEAFKYFSPKKQLYINNPDPAESEKISFAWQYESLYVMEWSLGLIDNLDFPDHICDVPLLVRIMKQFQSIADMVESCKMRTIKELLDQCDLIFCLDWACVDTRINHLTTPAGMEGSVVMERHKSLNWLCAYDNLVFWDDVSTDT